MTGRAANRDVLHVGDRVEVRGLRGVPDGARGIVSKVSRPFVLVHLERGESLEINQKFVTPVQPPPADDDTTEVEMINVSIKVDASKALNILSGLARNQVPFATALALTKTAQAVKAAEVDEMRKVFARPVPYTLGSLFVRKATKANLTATVGVKDLAVKAMAPVLHLGDRIAVHGMRGVVDGERGIVVQVSAQWLLVRMERGGSMHVHERFVRAAPAAEQPDSGGEDNA